MFRWVELTGVNFILLVFRGFSRSTVCVNTDHTGHRTKASGLRTTLFTRGHKRPISVYIHDICTAAVQAPWKYSLQSLKRPEGGIISASLVHRQTCTAVSLSVVTPPRRSHHPLSPQDHRRVCRHGKRGGWGNWERPGAVWERNAGRMV